VETLHHDISELLKKPERLGTTPPLWDGQTAGRIVDELLAYQPSNSSGLPQLSVSRT
jgi:hypothetical protein